MVPLASQVLRNKGVYDPSRLFGVTMLDCLRARTFGAEHMKMPPLKEDVPIIGGHSGTTILPLFSQVPGFSAKREDLQELTTRIQFGGDEVVKAKAGEGSATLSMAYAGYVSCERILRAMVHKETTTMCAFVESALTDAPFFASPCRFGKDGYIEEVLSFGELSEFEREGLDNMLPVLKKQIQKGLDFVKEQSLRCRS